MQLLKKYHFLLFTSVILLFACSDEEPLVETGLDTTISYEEIDVSFGSDPLQTYDVYLPANRSQASTNTLIVIHGGGWTSGDKDDVSGIVDLVQLYLPDYAVINMNYRLTTKPNNPFSDQLEDVDLAIADVRSRNTEYDISDNFALIGVSAGGHMAMQHSYTKNETGHIKAVGNIVGPTYFLDSAYTMSSQLSYQLLALEIQATTGEPFTSTEFYENISPLSVADVDAVPTIQFHGSEDPLIPVSQGPLLAERLDELGVPNELIIYEGEGHGWSDLTLLADTGQKYANFIERYITQ